MNKEQQTNEVLRLWGIELNKIRKDILIAGSPDRCLFRSVIEDKKGQLYILESLPPELISHKKRIALTLDFLMNKGLAGIYSSFHLEKNEYIAIWQNHYWQLSPYIDGIPLERPSYAFEGWRGPSLARFLINLWEISKEIPYFDKSFPFSIVSFNKVFMDKIESREPTLHQHVLPASNFLEQKFITNHANLPIRFCHGDFHPLNVIWSAKGINAVIDWEFLGYKPEIYDVAMMIGCLGMEKPQSLTGDLVFEFVKHLKEAALISKNSWSLLFEFVLALRFGWLSDWLKRSDREMVDLEAVYIQLLLENREIFIKSWGIGDFI
ncbi:phosphotransferase [Acidobacteriota bacterium]